MEFSVTLTVAVEAQTASEAAICVCLLVEDQTGIGASDSVRTFCVTGLAVSPL